MTAKSKIVSRYTNGVDRDVLEGLAEALWVSAWGNHEEAAGQPWRGGGDWFDAAPEVPAAAYEAADLLADSLIKINRMSLDDLVAEARSNIRGHHRWGKMPLGQVARLVGRDLAMEALTGGKTTDMPAFNHSVPSFEALYDGTHLTWALGSEVRAMGWSPGARRNPADAGDQYVVVRVNGDDSDTHAAPVRDGDVELAKREALGIALPDRGARLEYAIVTASDAGAARITRPRSWAHLPVPRGPRAKRNPAEGGSAVFGPTEILQLPSEAERGRLELLADGEEGSWVVMVQPRGKPWVEHSYDTREDAVEGAMAEASASQSPRRFVMLCRVVAFFDP